LGADRPVEPVEQPDVEQGLLERATPDPLVEPLEHLGRRSRTEVGLALGEAVEEATQVGPGGDDGTGAVGRRPLGRGEESARLATHERRPGGV
jgi:hypothetical protein